MVLGYELQWDESLSPLARLYCRLLGVPIVGLRIRWRRIRGLLPRAADAVLDAGCGRGVITRALASRYPGATVEAVDDQPDLQARNAMLADKMGLNNCRFLVEDLLSYRRDGRYDLVVSVDNLEHIHDDAQVLENLFHSLRPAGHLLVHVPHYFRRWPVLKWSVNFDVPGHVRPGYRLEEIRSRVETTGFRVRSSGFSYGLLENLSNNISYAITGAEERNRIIYALSFPFLNALAWIGQWGRLNRGAGVWVLARKPPARGVASGRSASD